VLACVYVFYIYNLSNILLIIGNIESLKETPSTKGIDLYENLQIFHRHYYSAHFMTLCVQAKGRRSH